MQLSSNEPTEVIYEKDNEDLLPEIIRVRTTYYLGDSAKPYDGSKYSKFFASVKHTIETEKNIVIDFNIGFYNSKSILMLRDLFVLLNTNYTRCKPFVNWYYLERDTNMFEAGNDYAEDYPNITFNLLLLNE